MRVPNPLERVPHPRHVFVFVARVGGMPDEPAIRAATPIVIAPVSTAREPSTTPSTPSPPKPKAGSPQQQSTREIQRFTPAVAKSGKEHTEGRRASTVPYSLIPVPRSLVPVSSISRTTRAFNGLHGLPAHTIHTGMDRVTSDRAPITAPSPMVTPGEIRQPEATQACD